MEIRVNDVQWAEIGEDDQNRIEEIVKGFFKDATIVPDADTPPIDVGLKEVALADVICKAACNIAEAAAIAACALLGEPIAIAACVALAKAAGDECRRLC